MFDIGWSELLAVCILGVLVMGPKEIPAAVKSVTTFLKKLAIWRDQVWQQVEEMGGDELKELKQAHQAMRSELSQHHYITDDEGNRYEAYTIPAELQREHPEPEESYVFTDVSTEEPPVVSKKTVH